MNGCLGKLVVRDTKANDPHSGSYDYDLAEHGLIIFDWSASLAENYMPGTPNAPLNVVSLLFNGFGTNYNPATNTRAFAPIAAFYAQRGKRYRWRVDYALNQFCPVELCVRIR